VSYCRLLEADAYIFLSSLGLECCGCSLAPRKKLEQPYIDILGNSQDYKYEHIVFETAQGMLDHIKVHRDAGDYIPQNVDIDIKKDFPDLNASLVETEEERLARKEQEYPAIQNFRRKIRETYNERKHIAKDKNSNQGNTPNSKEP
jgi:hypothetical protein